MKNPEKIFSVLDKYEEFDPKNPRKSLYIRKIKRAFMKNKKPVYVYVYIFNKTLTNPKNM